MEMQPAGELGLEGGGAGPGKGRKRRGKNGQDHGGDVAGRKDPGGQEGVIDKTALVKGFPKAIKMERELADLKEDMSALYKTLAEQTNLNAAQIRSAAKAHVADKLEEAKRKAAQMTLILEETASVGE